jgi:hypothetical protein
MHPLTYEDIIEDFCYEIEAHVYPKPKANLENEFLDVLFYKDTYTFLVKNKYIIETQEAEQWPEEGHVSEHFDAITVSFTLTEAGKAFYLINSI